MAVTESGHLAAEAIDDLYRSHGTDVYRYAFAVLGNRADAEDVTQTTFLNAYRALEQGVRPRKPSNWLLAIASNAIKQRFRQEQARPRLVELDERTAGADTSEMEGPTVRELLAALSKIPPQQRQALVLREFEGRSYGEIAEILDVTTGALETLLFRARRSLAEELEHRLTCTEAQLAVSRAVDDRLGRKERRRLREHLSECPDCAHFASIQKRHRRALKGLMLVPVPLSLSLLKGIEGTASAATLPTATAATTAGVGAAGATGSGLVAGGVALKAAAVVTAATVATGVAVTGSSEDGARPVPRRPGAVVEPGERIGQVAPRGVVVPGNGVARGKTSAPGRLKSAEARARAATKKQDARGAARGRRGASSRSKQPPQPRGSSTVGAGSKAQAKSSGGGATQTSTPRITKSAPGSRPAAKRQTAPKKVDAKLSGAHGNRSKAP